MEKLEDGIEETRRDLLIIGEIISIIMWCNNLPLTAGQVLDQTQPEGRIHIKARLVRFSWQRGVKIGEKRISLLLRDICILLRARKLWEGVYSH